MDCLAAFRINAQWVYLLCFLVGLFYAVLTAVLGGLFGGHEGGHVEAGGVEADAGVDVDTGGLEADTGGADLGGGAEAAGAGGHEMDLGYGPAAAHDLVDQGAIHFSPLSPIVIAMFLTAFGGGGMIAMGPLKMRTLVSVPFSLASGLLVGALTFLLFYKLIQATQASSEAAVAALVGEPAEVIVAIPRDGLGEIAYVARGTRYTAPAKSDTGMTIAMMTPVIIRRIVGSTFYVAPKR